MGIASGSVEPRLRALLRGGANRAGLNRLSLACIVISAVVLSVPLAMLRAAQPQQNEAKPQSAQSVEHKDIEHKSVEHKSIEQEVQLTNAELELERQIALYSNSTPMRGPQTKEEQRRLIEQLEKMQKRH